MLFICIVINHADFFYSKCDIVKKYSPVLFWFGLVYHAYL